MMQAEVVERRRWMSAAEFLDLLGAAYLIPGPNSTEMAIHVGYRRAGWAGLLVAGSCFILPAALIVTILAWAYRQYGSLPQVVGGLYGAKPVVIAVVLQALWGLGRAALKTRLLVVVAIIDVALGLLGINELVLLFGTGVALVCVALWRQRVRTSSAPLVVVLPYLSAAATHVSSAAAVVVSFELWRLFLFFLKVGAVLFGSGYVLLAFLRADLVMRWHWLTESQLLDAIAVGQLTPGPVFTTATFIGYLLGGTSGAVVATVGIFLPAFFFVAVSGPLVPRLRRSKIAAAFLDGVNVASLGLMAVVTAQIGGAALVDVPSIVLFVVGGVLLVRLRLSAAWLVPGAAVLGWLWRWHAGY
jgi:chromate transporter